MVYSIAKKATIGSELLEKKSQFSSIRKFKKLSTRNIESWISTSRRQSKIDISQELSNWVLIFDELADYFLRAWIVAIPAVFEGGKRKGKGKKENEIAYFLLLGAIVNQCFALRLLVLSGFDSNAKSTARQLCEHLDLLRATIDDHALAIEFSQAQTLEDERAFWFKHVSKNKLERRVVSYRAKMFRLTDNALEKFSEWRKEEKLVFSTASHPSKIGSYIRMVSGSKASFLQGISGAVDDGSVRTLYYVCFELLEFIAFHPGFKFLARYSSIPSKPGAKKIMKMFDEEADYLDRMSPYVGSLIEYFRKRKTRAYSRKEPRGKNREKHG